MIEKRERFAVREVTRGLSAEHDPVTDTFKIFNAKGDQKRISAEEFALKYEVEAKAEEEPRKKGK